MFYTTESLNQKKIDEKFLVIVECAIEYQQKFLVIQRPEGVHAAGLLAFPGGKVEQSDGHNNADILIEAVKREVFEEVGLKLIDPLYFVTSSYFVDSRQTQVVDVIFYCQLEKTNPSVTASPREVPAFAWLSDEEILAHDNSPVWLKKYLGLIPQKLRQ
jgi:8-oxo-dGTP diphosphatase